MLENRRPGRVRHVGPETILKCVCVCVCGGEVAANVKHLQHDASEQYIYAHVSTLSSVVSLHMQGM